jgi:uncharacterized membrane protein
MNKMKTIAGQLLVAIVPLVYLYFIWNTLPESIPTHFNGRFEADKFGTKSDILTALLVMALVSIGLSLLINNLNAIDPKKRYPDENSLMKKISWTVVIFISLLMLIIVYTTKNYGQANISSLFHKSIFILVALIFAVLGKLMTNLKPNYFIGIRTPWTLEDGDNWQKTHQLASRIWFWGGLLTLVLIIIMPADYTHYIFLSTIIPIALVPVVYSFILFREKKRKGSNG